MIVGEAKVVIRAIGGKLESDIQKALDRAGAKAGGSGEKTGKDYADGVAKGIDKNNDGISKSISDPIEKATKNATEKAGKEASKNIQQGLDKGGKQLEATGERIGKRVGESVTRGFQKSRMTTTIGKALVKLGVFVPVIGAVVGAISALVSGLFAIVGALGTASASSVALGNVLTAGIQGIAVFVIAFKGVGKAIGEGFKADNVEKFNEALEKVAPAARPFVKEFVGLKKDFVAIRNAAAEGLFPGLERSLSAIAPLLPKMREGFKAAGDAAGDATDNFFKAVTTGNAKSNFAGLTTANNAVVRQFGTILGEVSATLFALFNAATPLTARFVGWLEKGATSLRKMTEAGESNGNLSKYLGEAGDVAATFGRIIGNIFEGLYDIGKIAQPTGLNLLAAFEAATDKLADFTDNLDNVGKTQNYFKAIEKNVISIGGLVNALGASFIRMGASPGIAATADAFKKIMPDIEKALITGVESIGPRLAVLVGEIAKLFSALEESGTIAFVIDIFTAVAKALTAVATTPVLGPAVLGVLKLVAAFKALSLIAKLGRFMFSPILKPLEKSGGLQSGLSGATSGFLKFKQTVGNIGNVSKGARGRIDSLALGTQSLAQRLGVSERASFRAGNAASKFGTVIANTGSRVGAAIKPYGRVAASAGLLGLAATGVADKVGLSNTVMLAGIGAAVPGWGIAIGAAAGFALDLKNAAGPGAEAIKAANAAMASGDPRQYASALSQVTKEMAKIGDRQKSTGLKDWFSDQTSDLGGRFKSALKFKDYDGVMSEAQKGLQSSASKLKLKLKLQADTEIVPTLINAQNTLNSVKEFTKSIKSAEDKRKFTVTFGQEGYTETLGFISELGGQLKTLGKGPARDAVKKQLLSIGESANISRPALDLLIDKVNGVAPAIKQLPNGKEVKLTANDAAFLSTLGYTQEQLDQYEADHNARLGIEVVPGSKPALDALTGQVTTFDGTTATAGAGVNITPGSKPALDALFGQVTNFDGTTATAGAGVTVAPGTPGVFSSLFGRLATIGSTVKNATVGATASPNLGANIGGVIGEVTSATSKPVNVPVGVKPVTGLFGFIGKLKETFAPVSKPITTTVSVKTTGTKNINSLKESIRGVKSKTVSIKVSTAGGKAVSGVKSAIRGIKGTSVKVRAIVIGTATVVALNRRISSLKGSTVKVAVTGATRGTSEVKSLTRAISSIRGKSVRVIANTTGQSALSQMKNTIDNIRSKSTTLTVTTVKKSVKAATGGLITGPGTGVSDSIPAMLSNGEYVIRAAQVQKFKPLLDSINSNRPLPNKLPNMAASTGTPAASTRGSSNVLQLVGALDVNLKDGKAYISAYAQDTYDNNTAYTTSVKGMNQ